MKSIQHTILVVAFLFSGHLFAQNDLLRVRNFGIEDGLSQRNIFKVQQDKDGFLWVVTKNGLDRYDGHEFIHWYEGDEKSYLPNGVLFDAIVGQEGRIFVSRGDVLIRTNHKSGSTDTLELLPRPAQNAWFNSLCQDGMGHIWATKFNASDSSSWLQRTNKEGQFTDIAQLPGRYAHRPITKASGYLYVGAYENEIWVFDLDGKQTGQFEFPAPANDKSFSRVLQLQTDANGTVWALLEHGQLYSLHPTATAFKRHPISEDYFDHFHPSAFLAEDNGDIWMGGLVSAHTDKHGDGSPCSSIQPGVALLHFNSISQRVEDYSYFLKQVLPYAEPPRQIFKGPDRRDMGCHPLWPYPIGGKQLV